MVRIARQSCVWTFFEYVCQIDSARAQTVACCCCRGLRLPLLLLLLLECRVDAGRIGEWCGEDAW